MMHLLFCPTLSLSSTICKIQFLTNTFVIIKEDSQRASNRFIEDQQDICFIILQTMIEEVGQEEVLEI